MKLSIVIPTYRFDCTPLVQRLLVMLPEDAEIVVGDDGSPNAEKYLTALESLPSPRPTAAANPVRVIRQRPNKGRSAIRNLLAREAQGEYLLYMDCDGMPVGDDFLQRYLALLPTEKVICGSVRHPDCLPSPDVSLRYTYEKQAERRFTAHECNRHPHRSFRTFHFLIPRATMLAHPFDESFRLPGYEDVLLGKRLQENGVEVLHIENDVMNTDLEPNALFLRKTEQQLHTLHEMRHKLQGYSTLLAHYERLQCFGLAPLLRLWHRCFSRLEQRLLMHRNPCISLFQLYKLGYYAGLD